MRRRLAIVTGGSTGIGRACAIRLAESGHDVAITYAHEADEASQTAEVIRQTGARVFSANLDLSDPASAPGVIDSFADQLGGVDTFVSNAGMMIRKPLDALEVEALHKIFDVNVFGALLAIRQSLRHMCRPEGGALPDDLSHVSPRAKDNPGRIIVITSVHEHFANPTDIAYTMTKHALGAMVKGLAIEFGELNITVNAVAPGEIATPMNDMDATDADSADRPAIPMRSVGKPNDVADIVAFLARPETNFVTGASWLVDGGFMAATPLVHGFFRREFAGN